MRFAETATRAFLTLKNDHGEILADGELVQAPRRVAEGSLLRMRRSFIDRALSGAARGE